MADSDHLYGKTPFPANHTSQLNSPVTTAGQAKAKSFTHFFGKFLFFALFLIAIPLFPSQAPDFMSQTLLTKFWELFHLLFIGIAVSYGVFCRRNVDTDIQTYSNNDDPQSYVSTVLHVSSIFGDGYDNSYGYDEKNVYQPRYDEKNKSEFTNESSVISEQSQTESVNCEIGFKNPCGSSDNNVSQAWNSQYFRGESMVVVDQPNYALNEYGESGLIMNHKPLDLPVRSLRAGIRNQASPEISNGSASSSILTDSSNSPSNYDRINERFGDLGPLNLEDKFNNTAALSSPISWRSRSGISGDVGISTHPSHFRPLSVDETQFESLKSHSFWSTESFSSQLSSMSDSPNRLSPSHSDSSELENLKMDDDMRKEKSFRRSYPPTSIPMNGKTSLNALRIRRYGNGSLFEKNTRKSFEDDLKGNSGSKRQDPLGYREWKSGSSRSGENPTNLVKASSRGKSVRTIRGRAYAEEAVRVGERSGNHIKDNVAKAANDEIDAGAGYEKNEMRSGGFDNLSTGSRKQDPDNDYPMPKPTFSEFENRKHNKPPEDFAVESKEEPESEVENFQLNPNEEALNNCVNDAPPDPDEVDKKAGEFIAKFREQIRLQKMASIDRSRGRNYFR